MENSTITIYQTHIEIAGATQNERTYLMKLFSKYDRVRHTYIPISCYELDGILYVPRGANVFKIGNYLHTKNILTTTKPNPFKTFRKVEFLGKPKNSIQEDAIKFLTSEGQFQGTDRYSQKALNIDTGDGKTFSVVCNVIQRRIRTLIIVDKDILKSQWINEFLKFSTMEEARLYNIESQQQVRKLIKTNKKDLEWDIYFINHQTIASFAKTYGWIAVSEFIKHLGIGIKVIDEAHEFFRNTLMIDFFSNVAFNIYLTATFERSDERERTLFKEAFSTAYRFGQETLNYEDKVRHIIYIPTMFQSFASPGDALAMQTKYGFSSARYSKYVLDGDSDHRCLYNVLYIIEKTRRLEGRTLVIAPTIEACDRIHKFLSDKLETEDQIGIIHSKITETPDDVIERCRIIISTIRSIGVGVNIKKLRVLINIEPIASQVTSSQLIGRLRKYDNTDKETFFFDLIDASIPKCMEFYNRRLPAIRKKVKEIKKTEL